MPCNFSHIKTFSIRTKWTTTDERKSISVFGKKKRAEIKSFFLLPSSFIQKRRNLIFQSHTLSSFLMRYKKEWGNEIAALLRKTSKKTKITTAKVSYSKENICARYVCRMVNEKAHKKKWVDWRKEKVWKKIYWSRLGQMTSTHSDILFTNLSSTKLSLPLRFSFDSHFGYGCKSFLFSSHSFRFEHIFGRWMGYLLWFWLCCWIFFWYLYLCVDVAVRNN